MRIHRIDFDTNWLKTNIDNSHVQLLQMVLEAVRPAQHSAPAGGTDLKYFKSDSTHDKVTLFKVNLPTLQACTDHRRNDRHGTGRPGSSC